MGWENCPEDPEKVALVKTKSTNPHPECDKVFRPPQQYTPRTKRCGGEEGDIPTTSHHAWGDPKQPPPPICKGRQGARQGGSRGGKLQQRRCYHWGVAGSGKERDGNLRRRRFTFCTPLPPDGHGGCDDEASHGIPKRTYLRACATCVVHALRDEGNRTGKRRGEVGKRGRGEGERGHNLV